MQEHEPGPLDRLSIPEPCPMAEALAAGERVDRRFCDQCDKHVVNLSALTKAEAEAEFVQARQDQQRLCVRVVRDEETGRVLTREDLPTLTERLAMHRPRQIAAALALALLQWSCSTEESTEAQRANETAAEIVGETNQLYDADMERLLELSGYVCDER